MGLVSGVLPRLWNYTQRAVKVYPSAVFGTKGQDILTKAYTDVFTAKGAVKYNVFSGKWWEQLWQGTKAAGKASEKYAASFAGKGFWSSMWGSVKGIPTKVAQGWRVGGKLAAKQGAGKLGQFWGSTKGAMAGIGKKMPIIGSLILVACELPNIFRATKDEGLGSGLVETGKAAARIGAATLGSSAGAAIGSAICPGIGTAIGGIIGWIAGEWAAKRVVGKSYSEKQEEQQEKIQAAIQQQTQQQQPLQFTGATNPTQYASAPSFTPQQMTQMQNMLYSNNAFMDDFMYKSMQRLNYQA